MHGAIKWFSRNHVAGNFLMLVVLIAGMVTWFSIKKEIFPETAFDAVAVRVPFPNATPEEVETGVCIPIEEAIADLQGIKKIRSTAAQNIGTVIVEVEVGYRVRDVMNDVKSRVDAIDNFPEETEQPVLEEVVIKAPVMSLALMAETDEATLNRLAEQVRDDLLASTLPRPSGIADIISRAMRGDPRISQIEIAGTRPYEISIEVPEATLRELNLSLADIARAVRANTLDLPAGSIRTERGELILRSLGKRYEAAELADIPVANTLEGGQILLGEIATLIDGFEDIDLSSRFDARNAVLLNVFRVGSEDTLALASLARHYVENSTARLPEGATLSVWNDQSTYLTGRIALLQRNGMFGLTLVLLVLTLFLRPSLALLVALGIPVSFAGGLWLMPMLGISLNMISLFAFILVLGIVVDDAIVTGENVYTRIQKGEHPAIAAWKGTNEVNVVVVFGVLTTMIAFTPMLGLSGVSGKIWPNIPLVVIPTLMFSLLQSKFVLPAHLALLAPSDRTRPTRNPILKIQRKVAGGLVTFIDHCYVPALEVVLRWRYVTLAGFTALLIISVAIVGSGWIPFKFMPDVEGDILISKVELTQGVPFEETERIVKRIEQAGLALNQKFTDRNGNPVIRHVLASAGTQPFLTGFNPNGPPRATHIGEVTLELVPAATRDVTSEILVAQWRRNLGRVPGVVELSFSAETAAGGNAIEVNLTGDNLARLAQATAFAKDGLAKFSGVIDITDSNREGKDELRITAITPAGRALGFTMDAVALQIRDAFYGNEVQRLQRGRDEVKIMVRFPEADRRHLDSLESMKLRTPTGDQVPITDVVVLEAGRGVAVINRTDRQRSIKITADVEPGVNANQVVAAFTTDVLNQIPERFPGVRYNFEGEQEDQNRSVREIGIRFLFALIAMFVVIAIPLRSYFQPLIIMSVIPFGIVGAIWGHAIMRLDLSIMSMCGLVALAGVVVNNSLVMVEFVNRHRAESSTIHDAAVAAGRARFRAILLTSLTTFVGIMPMVLETDMQARFLIPMAVALGYGILFATFLTLFLVPSIYLILEDISGKNPKPSERL
ncbi:MAG: efflux RND transporter permease subunit [Luteolibacter sp.]